MSMSSWSTGRSITLADAALIFEGWLSSRALVRARTDFSFLAVSVRGRLIFLSETEVRIAVDGDGPRPEFNFVFSGDFEIWYSDTLAFPEEGARFVCALIFALPGDLKRDLVIFEEEVTGAIKQ